ncbi:MAG: hypothetical protein Q8R85_11390 [Bosea sp. (in: a-proteobacteria)]|uniref:hypothetical protein n=1 Tax=Bosea sp. (in: a-proteobacteria) TaxID=1871050 RepID=UPI0027327CF3|nr:hypothetical protein [Bosea sp. (in: a-proteobacteria)]MDP3601756.1 hypothetical protein [Bosea sp. (in: a-proteobacteria)]
MLVPDRGPHEARRAELDQRDDIRRFVDVIGGVVAVNMAGKALIRLAFVMGMPMLRDLGSEFRVPHGFGMSDGVGIVAGRDVRRRQGHAERHREGDDEARQGFDAAAQHDEQIGTEILTEV